MRKRQRLALEHPSLAEEQCASDGYRWLRLPWSVLLTLNVGLDDAPVFDGLPPWHCSIALLAPRGVPLALGCVQMLMDGRAVLPLNWQHQERLLTASLLRCLLLQVASVSMRTEFTRRYKLDIGPGRLGADQLLDLLEFIFGGFASEVYGELRADNANPADAFKRHQLG